MDKVLKALIPAAAAFGSGAVVIAQGVLSTSADTIERILGGGFLLVVGTIGFRWAYQLLKAVRDDNTDLRAQLAEMTARYHQERDLRLSLEERGIADRRRRSIEGQ